MKTELTREESQHLIDLGVPKEKASLQVLFEEDGPFDIWNEDILARPIFTLADLLDILPKEIEGWGIRAIKYNPIWEMEMAFYDRADMVPCKATELIDTLYQLACWYYETKRKDENKTY